VDDVFAYVKIKKGCFWNDLAVDFSLLHGKTVFHLLISV
jgi:hypothetical protein